MLPFVLSLACNVIRDVFHAQLNVLNRPELDVLAGSDAEDSHIFLGFTLSTRSCRQW